MNRRARELVDYYLDGARNPLLIEFRRSWDRSRAGVEAFRATLAGRPEPSSIRDEADEFLADLARALGGA